MFFIAWGGQCPRVLKRLLQLLMQLLFLLYNGKNGIEHGLTWSLLLCLKRRSRFHQVVLPWTKLATICSWRARHSVLLCLPGRIKGFRPWNTSLLTTFQVEVWKKFWKLSRPKVSIFRVCLRTLWRNKTVRWISGPSWSRRILWQNIGGAGWRSFCPQPVWQHIVEVSSRIVFGNG